MLELKALIPEHFSMTVFRPVPCLIVINCCRRRRGCGTRWRRCPRASSSPSTEPSLPHPSSSLPNPRSVRIMDPTILFFSDPDVPTSVADPCHFGTDPDQRIRASYQGCGSGLDPDPIGSVDPDSESGSGSRRAKMAHKSRKNL